MRQHWGYVNSLGLTLFFSSCPTANGPGPGSGRRAERPHGTRGRGRGRVLLQEGGQDGLQVRVVAFRLILFWFSILDLSPDLFSVCTILYFSFYVVRLWN